ncbi:TPR-like protein [Coprinellus micaceus]|uniref:TPR-like protein n=1 Tax=Coprinellus micaceus TaxID=71717 RepID=A0A4Y7SQC6_COPMI|nr:TPR-like protein [Coprinellus micaceus]
MDVPPSACREPTRSLNGAGVTPEELVLENNQRHDRIVYDSSNNHYGDTYNTSTVVYGPATNVGQLNMIMDNDYVLFDTLPKHPDISSQWNDYLEDSRDGDMMRIRGWGDDLEGKELMLWVYSPAGTGKSTLARQLTHNLWAQNRLAASIFFSILCTDTLGPDTVFRLIGGEIGRAHPSIIPTIARAVRKSHGAPLQVLVDMFVRDPLQALKLPYPLIVVMDAVDEWRSHYHFFKELRHLSPLSSLVRFIVFGRSEPRHQHFKELSIRSHPLRRITVEIMQQYIDRRFSRIEWPAGRKPGEHQIMGLARMANGLFIWIATTCALLERPCSDPHATLTSIVHNRHNVGENHTLAKLYYDAIGLLFPDPESKDAVRELLGFMLVLQEPLPVEAFCSLSGINGHTLTSMMSTLKALQIRHPTNSRGTVYPANMLFHASFVEYLGSASIPPEIGFLISLPAFHLRLGKACLQAVAQIPSGPNGLNKLHLSPKSRYGVKLWPFHVVEGTLPEEPDLTQLEKQVQRPPLLRRLARQTKALILKRPTGDRSKPTKRTSMTDLLEGIVTLKQLCWWAPLFLQVLRPEYTSSPTLEDGIPSLMCSVVTLLDAEAASAIVFKASCLEVAVWVAPHDAENWRRLGGIYTDWAETTDSPELVHQGVRACRHALQVAQASLDNNCVLYMHLLASSLWKRAERLGNEKDLEEAICLGRDALKLKLYLPLRDRARHLRSLAVSLQSRFERAGSAKDLEEAILLHRQALELHPSGHAGRPSSLNNLASALHTNFEQSGLIGDLEEAIMLHRQALELHPSGHPDRAMSLNNLANALQTNFRQSGFVGDLEEAMMLHRQALELHPSGHAGRPSSLNNLASALHTNFEQSGLIGDLEEAIGLHRQALELRPSGHPDRAMQSGFVGDLEEAIMLHRQALELRPSGHPGRSSSLNNLANALQTNFEQSGFVGDLEEAIGLHRQVLELRPSGHPGRSSSLNNLANALQTNFRQSGFVGDLEEAIGLHRQVLELRPSGHPGRSSSLNNLANALQTNFEQSGFVGDLEEAIGLHRQALELRPSGHPDRSLSLNNLASTLFALFKISELARDLDEAIEFSREVLLLRPQGHPKRADTLWNVRLYLYTRFEDQGTVEDLREAIALSEEALAIYQPGSSDHEALLRIIPWYTQELTEATSSVGGLDFNE